MRMQIQAVSNLKGGAGKTTSCVTLADVLQQVERQVLVVDMDPQGTASAWLHKRTQACTELLTGDFRPGDHVAQVTDHLHVIPANRSLERASEQRPTDLAQRLERLWRGLSGFDVVLIDTPPQAGKLVTAALMASDRVLCPVSPGQGSVDGLVHLMDYTHRIGGAPVQMTWACALDLRSTMHKTLPDTLQDKMGDRAAETYIRATVAMQEAEVAQTLPSTYCPSSTAYKDYTALTHEIYDL